MNPADCPEVRLWEIAHVLETVDCTEPPANQTTRPRRIFREGFVTGSKTTTGNSRFALRFHTTPRLHQSHLYNHRSSFRRSGPRPLSNARMAVISPILPASFSSVGSKLRFTNSSFGTAAILHCCRIRRRLCHSAGLLAVIICSSQTQRECRSLPIRLLEADAATVLFSYATSQGEP